jgi:hypothetical protein
MSMILLLFETLSYSIVKSLSFWQFVLSWSWYARTIGILHTLILCMLTFISQYLFKTFQFTCPWPPLFLDEPWAVILFHTFLLISLFLITSLGNELLYFNHSVATLHILPLNVFYTSPPSESCLSSILMLFIIITFTFDTSISYIDVYLIPAL